MLHGPIPCKETFRCTRKFTNSILYTHGFVYMLNYTDVVGRCDVIITEFRTLLVF